MKYTIENPKEVTYFIDPEGKNFTGVVKSKNSNIAYHLNGKLHRTDGPAVIRANGTTEYWVNDKKLPISTDQELKDYLILRMFE